MIEPNDDRLDALVSKKIAQLELAFSPDDSRDIFKSSKSAISIVSDSPEVLEKILNNKIKHIPDFAISILDNARQYFGKDLFEYLVAQGADLTVQDSDSNTIVHLAMEGISDNNFHKKYHDFFGKIKNIYVDSVLSKHVQSGTLRNMCNIHGFSYLHVACMLDRTDIVKFFLDHGECVNRRISASSTMLPGYTPLHLAFRYCAFKTTQLLLAHGANLYALDSEGISPLHLLLQWSMIIRDNMNMDMLNCYKVFTRDLEINETVLQMVYKKDMMFPDGLNSVHIACSMQSPEEVVKLIQTNMHIDYCIRSDAKLWPGYTALHFAAHFNLDTFKLLMDHGGDILIEDSNGFTPLDLCLQRYGGRMLDSILIKQPSWETILFADSQTKLVDLVSAMDDENAFTKFLTSMSNINTHIPLNAPIWPGCTPLHLAVLLAEKKREDLYEQTDYKKLYFSEKKEVLYEQRVKACLSLKADVTVQDAFGCTPVHLAYRLESTNVIKLLLQHHPKLVNPIDATGLSHLHIACAAENIDLVDSLLYGGADVNSQIVSVPTSSAVKDKRRLISNLRLPVPLGPTPLHIAIEVKNQELIELLVKRGADLYSKNAKGSTPIHNVLQSAQWGKLTKCPSLYENLKNVSVNGFSPLLVSALANNVDAVERYLKLGENVESAVGQVSTIDGESLFVSLKRFEGYRALHFAVYKNSRRMVQLLLEHDADIFAKSNDGTIPLYMSFRRFSSGKTKVLFGKLLESDHVLQTRVERETGITMLHIACGIRDVGLAKEALKSGIDVNARTFENSPIWPNSTPLHSLDVHAYDTDESLINLLRILLDHGADVAVESNSSHNPILCCWEGYYEYERNNEINDYSVMDNNKALNLLLSALHDYSVNTHSYGMTLFHVACGRNALVHVEGFLKAGVDVNLQVDYRSECGDGMTPLHFALKSNAMEAFDLLMKHGANVRVDDVHGDTPLHLAIRSSALNLDLLDRILRAGADVNALNIYGETPFERLLRSSRHSNEMVKLFIKYADCVNFFNPTTNEGLVGIAFNCLQNPMEIVEMFNSSSGFLKVDDKGRNTLHNLVCKKPDIARSLTEYIDIIEKIMSMGCDIDAADTFGRTPLCTAVQLNNYQGIAGLLECGADINVIDGNGKSAFSYGLGIRKDHRNCDKINLLLATYVEKKQFVGLHCLQQDRKNLQKAMELLNFTPLDYESILDKLKLASIESTTVTLYDFLSETGAVAAYPHMIHNESQAVDDFFKNNRRQLRKAYSKWSGLLNYQYRKAQARVALMEPAMTALRYLTESILDELCYVGIVRYLSNEELKLLIGSVSVNK